MLIRIALYAGTAQLATLSTMAISMPAVRMCGVTSNLMKNP